MLALGITSTVKAEKALLVVHDKTFSSDETYNIDEFERILAYKDSNCQDRFKDETCTYYNKKGHTELVCFSKCDNVKLAKMADLADRISASSKCTMESTLNKLDKLNLKGIG